MHKRNDEFEGHELIELDSIDEDMPVQRSNKHSGSGP